MFTITYLRKAKRKLSTSLRILFSAILLLAHLVFTGQDVVINEFMSSNFNCIADEDGDYSDWIELYNGGSSTIDLAGYHISDNPANLYRWEFPPYQLEPGGFLIVFASGKDRAFGPYFHTNFSIDKQGEPLYLLRADNVIVDSWPATSLAGNQSYGRVSDGAFDRCLFTTPTPGSPNGAGIPFHNHSISLLFSHEQGFYISDFDLNITPSSHDVSIHYTRDGSDPTPQDPVINGSLRITSLENEPNSISMIPTNVDVTWHDRGWKVPEGQVRKAAVVKAQAWKNGVPASAVYTKTYFVDPEIQEKYNGFPIISIVTDSLNLFDYGRGIYVPGLEHDLRPDIAPVEGHGNYNRRGREWERPAHLSVFESDGSLGLSQDIGIRTHGGVSRIWPIKSLRLYARDVYSKESMDYQFFPDKDTESFNSVLLRNSGNDFLSTYFTDALSSVLIENMDVEKQNYRPSVVYINGEYWGIHNLRQHMDAQYLENVKGANPDSVDMVERWTYTVKGSGHDFYELMDYVASNDLSIDTHYHHVAAQLDIQNLIDYFIAKQYIAVEDWPGNNIVAWRCADTNNKWRWLYYDNDGAFSDATFNAIMHSMYTSDTYLHHTEGSVRLFRKLFTNRIFRRLYLANFDHHLQHTFNPSRLLRHIDSLALRIEPLMEEHINRWGFPSSKLDWQQHVEHMRTFAVERPCHMMEHLQQHFPTYAPQFAKDICPEWFPGDETASPEFETEAILWPNPVNDVLFLSSSESNGHITSVIIYDISGRIIKRIAFANDANNRMDISTADLSAGTYILEMNRDGQSTHEKFIVARP